MRFWSVFGSGCRRVHSLFSTRNPCAPHECYQVPNTHCPVNELNGYSDIWTHRVWMVWTGGIRSRRTECWERGGSLACRPASAAHCAAAASRLSHHWPPNRAAPASRRGAHRAPSRRPPAPSPVSFWSGRRSSGNSCATINTTITSLSHS